MVRVIFNVGGLKENYVNKIQLCGKIHVFTCESKRVQKQIFRVQICVVYSGHLVGGRKSRVGRVQSRFYPSLPIVTISKRSVASLAACSFAFTKRSLLLQPAKDPLHHRPRAVSLLPNAPRYNHLLDPLNHRPHAVTLLPTGKPSAFCQRPLEI